MAALATIEILETEPIIETINKRGEALMTGIGEILTEADIPVREEVRAACEFLGLDPLYVANEGKVVIAIAADCADSALEILRRHDLGHNAAMIGRVTDAHRHVVVETPYGARRIVQMLTGAQLPRIC